MQLEGNAVGADLAFCGWLGLREAGSPPDELVDVMTGGAPRPQGTTTPAMRVVGFGSIVAAAVLLGWATHRWSAERPKDMNDQQSKARHMMVDRDLRARGISDPRVLEAMQRVPRHLFVPQDLEDSAYADRPLPIGAGQTISQPYIVALMTQLAEPEPHARALDIGTGSGYQAAVLSELCEKVYGIEIVESLAADAQERLARLGYDNVQVRAGDGYRGWPEQAPFDVIIVAAAPEYIPAALIEQLAPGGRMVIPVGRYYQDLTVVEKDADGTVRQWVEAPVAFVPMTGETQRPQSDE